MPTSVRNVTDIIIKYENNILTFDIFGEAFLKNMVRIMVGTILKANEGRITPTEIEELFESQDRTKAGVTMPPEGLTMVEIKYDWEKFRI